MKKINLITISLLTLLFISCSSKDANHLNIFSLPGAVIGSVLENASYNRKRVKVEHYAKANYEVLQREIKRGDGKHIDEILKLANVEAFKFTLVKQALKKEYQTIFHNVELTSEPIMQTFSKLYMPKSAKNKIMNGFTYTEAWNIVFQRVDRDFGILRTNVKSEQYDVLSKIADDLHINDKKKREIFLGNLDGKYDVVFLDPLVVSVMRYTP